MTKAKKAELSIEEKLQAAISRLAKTGDVPA